MPVQTKIDGFADLEKPNSSIRIPKIKGSYKIPANWKWEKLENVATLAMGQSPPGISYNKIRKGLPLINGPTEFGETCPNPVQWTTHSTKSCENGDILICVRGATTGRMNWADRNYCIGRGVAAIKPNSSVIFPKLLFFFLSTQTKELIDKSAGSTFPNLKSSKLRELKIPVPPRKEQERIVTLIEESVIKIEKATKLRQEAIQDSEKIMPSMLHYIFSKADEKGWKWEKLENVATIVGGHTPRRNVPEYWNGDIPWLTPTEIVADSIETVYNSKKKITKKGLKNSSAQLIPEGSVLYTSRASIGKIAVAGTSLTTNQGFTNFVCSDKVNNWYLAYCLKWLTPQIENEAGETTFKEIRRNRLRKFKAPIPPLKEQKRIVETLRKFHQIRYSLKSLQEDITEELSQLIPSILKKAFKGEF